MFCRFKLLFTILLIFTSIPAQDTCSNKGESECNAHPDCAFFWSVCHNITTGVCSSYNSIEVACNKKSECFYFYETNICADKDSVTCSSFMNYDDSCLNNGFIKCAVYTASLLFIFFFFFLVLYIICNYLFINLFIKTDYAHCNDYLCSAILVGSECSSTSGCELTDNNLPCKEATSCSAFSGDVWYAQEDCEDFTQGTFSCLWDDTRKVCSVDSSDFCSELDSNPTDCNASEYCIYKETSCISFTSATCGDLSGAANQNKCEKKGGCYYTNLDVCEDNTDCSIFNEDESSCNNEEQCVFDHSYQCQHISTLACIDLINNEGNFCEKRSDCFFFLNNCIDKSSVTCSNFNNDESACFNNGFLKCANYTVFFFFFFFLVFVFFGCVFFVFFFFFFFFFFF
jgi:hypothetical protein